MKIANPRTAGVALCLSLSSNLYAEVRQHGAHEHGVAQLLMAVDGQQVQLVLDSPMFNLAGFGQAESETQHQEVEEIEKMLNDPLALFALKGSECSVVSVVLEGGAFDEHEEGHDEHKDEHEEEHDDHKDEHVEGHDDHGESGHSDVHVEWSLDCSEPKDDVEMTVTLFEYFEHLEQLDVQYLSGNTQGADTLTAEQPVIRF